MITSHFRRCLGSFLLLVLTAAPVSAQFDMETKWIPDHSNTLVLINADQIFASPLAAKENWAAAGSGAFERGLSLVPPGVGKVMLASQLDMAFMEPVWTVGVFSKPNSTLSAAKLAQREGREVEQLGTHDTVALSGDQYVVQLDNSSVGFMVPANRQALSRWLQDGDAGRSARISEYLVNAVGFADKNADIIIAFDTNNLLSKLEARSRLMKLESARAGKIDALAEAATKLQGLTLGITVRDKINGSLRIDFADGTKDVALVNKRLIIEALSNNGVMINDFENWETSTEGSRVVFRGPLTTVGLRKLSSLINQPIRAQFAESAPAQESQPVSVGKSTRQYFDSIDLIFREMDEFLGGDRPTNARAYARWFDKYANSIDALPVRNVDPDMIEYGGGISSGFRDISQGLFGADATVKDRQARETGYDTNYAPYYYDNGYYYGYRRRSQSAIKADIKAQEASKAAATAKESIEALRKAHGDIRRAMGARYDDF